MTIQSQNIVVDGRNIEVYRFDLAEPDQRALYEVAKRQGLAKAPYTHAADPAGQRRPLIVVQASQILGTLADAFTAQILREQLPENIEVIRYDDVRTDQFKDPDKFDIMLKRGTEEKIVEVRSSIAKFLPNPARVMGQFRLLGWYSTANKLGEIIRDYYFQPIFITLDRNIADGANARTFKSKSYEYFEQGNIALYLLGGATRHDLETKGVLTTEEELLQERAQYQTMKLIDTSPIAEVLSHIKWAFDPQW